MVAIPTFILGRLFSAPVLYSRSQALTNSIREDSLLSMFSIITLGLVSLELPTRLGITSTILNNLLLIVGK